MSNVDVPISAVSNLHLARGVTATTFVSGDVFDICKRVAEVDPSLYIIQLEHDDRCAYAVMEDCSDGNQRLVSKHQELDQRIIDKMLYLKSVPFEHRFAEIEKQIEKEEAERAKYESDKLYETMGAPMLREFERCNFITPKNSKSYAKRTIPPTKRLG